MQRADSGWGDPRGKAGGADIGRLPRRPLPRPFSFLINKKNKKTEEEKNGDDDGGKKNGGVGGGKKRGKKKRGGIDGSVLKEK